MVPSYDALQLGVNDQAWVGVASEHQGYLMLTLTIGPKVVPIGGFIFRIL